MIRLYLTLLMVCFTPVLTILWSNMYSNLNPNYDVWEYWNFLVLSIVLLTLTSLFILIFMIISVRNSIAFNKIIKGEYLISWYLEGSDLQYFKDNENKIEITNRMKQAYNMGLILLGLSVIFFILDEERKFSSFFFILSIFIFLLTITVIKIRGKILIKRMKVPIGLFFLSDKYLIYNSDVHEINSTFMGLRTIGIEEIDNRLILIIEYVAKKFDIPSNYRNLKIPIPASEEDSFKNAVESIVSTINGEDSMCYQKDLITKNINLSVGKFDLLKSAIVLVSTSIIVVILSYIFAAGLYYNLFQ